MTSSPLPCHFAWNWDEQFDFLVSQQVRVDSKLRVYTMYSFFYIVYFFKNKNNNKTTLFTFISWKISIHTYLCSVCVPAWFVKAFLPTSHWLNLFNSLCGESLQNHFENQFIPSFCNYLMLFKNSSKFVKDDLPLIQRSSLPPKSLYLLRNC